MLNIILKALAIGAGVGATVCTIMNVIGEREAIILLGIGLAASAIERMNKSKEEN